MDLSINKEQLSAAFTKHHIFGLPFAASFNEFTEPDTGDPHDHPFDFITHILSGGYTERVYTIAGNNKVWPSTVERKPGTSHLVKATDIHKIISLHEDKCITLMLPQTEHIRKSGFYKFGVNKIYHRYWDEAEFKKIGHQLF